MSKQTAKTLGFVFIIIGLVLLIGPIGIEMSVIQVGPVRIEDIPQQSAISMGAGVILILIGIALAFGKKYF